MYRNRKYRPNSNFHPTNFAFTQNSSKSDNGVPSKLKKSNTSPSTGRENDDISQNQGSIPASQPPTQRRYLSQRSMLTKINSVCSLDNSKNYFESILMKVGANLDSLDCVVLNVDSIVFVNNLRSLIESGQNFPNNINDFIQGLNEILISDSNIKLFNGCTISIPGFDTFIQSQQSLIVNLLMIDFLQKPIIDILFDFIEKICTQNSQEQGKPLSFLPLALSQFKCISNPFGALVFEKLTNIFMSATGGARQEIICSAELVLHPSKHDDFIEFLMMHESTDSIFLNYHIVKSFDNLCLSTKNQGILRKKIMVYIKNLSTPMLLPLFIKFLLNATQIDDEVLFTLLSNLRLYLNWNKDNEIQENVKECQVEIFGYIEQALKTSKKVFDTWQKVIQKALVKEVRSLDFIVLLLLMTIREERSNYIENLIRRGIKQRYITVSTLIEGRKTMQYAFEKNVDSLLLLLNSLAHEKNAEIAAFVKCGYIITFDIDESLQKKVLTKLVESICDHTFSDLTTFSLDVLKAINEKHKSKVQTHGLILLPLLDHTIDLTLSQYRMVMEIMCSIAYGDKDSEDSQTLQDYIEMLVKKQIINRNPLVKKQGIVGIVQIVNFIACAEVEYRENMYDLNATYETLDELPEGKGKIAAGFISKALAATNYCPQSLALFYDEMATVFSGKILNKEEKICFDEHFLIWLTDLLTNFFLNFFVVEETPTGLNIEYSFQKCIDKPEEHVSSESEFKPIAINIAGCVFKPSPEAPSSIIVMTPLFNIMKILHFIRYKGKLESINALLGCAIILPTCFDKISEMINNNDIDKNICEKILDIYFYTINWYREIISSFSCQEDSVNKKKVLIRLQELIELEDSIQNSLRKCTFEYIPPQSNFITNESTSPIKSSIKGHIGRPKKAIKKGKRYMSNYETVNTENEGLSISDSIKTQNCLTKVLQRKPKDHSNKQRLKFACDTSNLYRQMGPEIMLLLREKMVLKFPLLEEDIGNYLGLMEFKFIVSDLINKLQSVIGIKKFNSEESNQYIINPCDLINDIVQVTPQVVKLFTQFTDSLKETLVNINYALGNANLFTDQMNLTKICFGLCLQLYSSLFSWSDFSDESNTSLLKKLLEDVINTSMFTTPEKTIDEFAAMAIKRHLHLKSLVIDMKSAVYLYHLVEILQKYTTNTFENDIGNLCKEFLSKPWYNFEGTMERGQSCNILLYEFLKGYFKNLNLEKIKCVTETVLDEVKFLRKKDDHLRIFPNINKVNFPILYKNMFEALTLKLNSCIYSTIDDLNMWESACEILNTFLEIVKSLHMSRIFALFLKYSHYFLKLFLQRGLTTVENSIRKTPERANELLKNLQLTTRFLHNLCCHSKTIKQTTIVSQIPLLRETIESLVFRVKAALAANNCSSVFWMGNLKNKDLQGDTILSQSLSAHTPDSASEDELPGDDSMQDTVLETFENMTEGNTSKSRVLSENSSRSDCF